MDNNDDAPPYPGLRKGRSQPSHDSRQRQPPGPRQALIPPSAIPEPTTIRCYFQACTSPGLQSLSNTKWRRFRSVRKLLRAPDAPPLTEAQLQCWMVELVS